MLLLLRFDKLASDGDWEVKRLFARLCSATYASGRHALLPALPFADAFDALQHDTSRLVRIAAVDTLLAHVSRDESSAPLSKGALAQLAAKLAQDSVDESWDTDFDGLDAATPRRHDWLASDTDKSDVDDDPLRLAEDMPLDCQ